MKHHNKKEKILETALVLIYQKGFKATGMRDIAEAMGFKVANIYNYIDSKEELLETFLFGISGEFHKGIDQITSSSYSPKEKLKAVIALHVNLTSQKPYQISLLVNEWRNLAEEKRRAFLAERNQYEAKVRSIIEAGIGAGEIRPMHVEIGIRTFLNAIRWMYDPYSIPDQQANPVELEKQITDFIFKGILS